MVWSTRNFSSTILSAQFYSVWYLNIVNKPLGDSSGGGTPGHIPNPEVKPASADGTWGVTPWESRSSPRGFSFLIDNLICTWYNFFVRGLALASMS
jgi:hypothetical protein